MLKSVQALGAGIRGVFLSSIINRQALACGVLFALLPAAATGGGLALAPLLAAAGVAGVAPKASWRAARTHWAPLGGLIGLVAWAVASAAWSPYPDHSQAVRLAAIVITGLMFTVAAGASAPTRAWVGAAGLAALVVLASLLGIEAVWDMPLNRSAQPDAETWALLRNPGRGGTVLVVMAFACAGWLAARRAWWALPPLLAAVAALSLQFELDANAIAFVCGAAGFGLGFAAPAFGIWVIAAALTAWLLGAPFLIPLLHAQAGLTENLPVTWATRFEMWAFVSDRIREQPWIGHGLDASRAIAGTIEVHGETQDALQLHPHSASLHIWLETGAVGAVLAAFTLFAGAARMARAAAHDRPRAAAICGVLAAAGCIANVSYGAWQEWWIAALFIAAGVIVAIPPRAAPAPANPIV